MLNKFILTTAMIFFLFGGTAMSQADDSNIRSITSVLPVERIEPSIPFWEAAGFSQGESVPEGDHLGFMMMEIGERVVMLQTTQSMQTDDAAFKVDGEDLTSFLFIQVKDIQVTAKALEGFDQVMPYRETFYGSKEVGYRSPGGHIITFAEFADRE